jgi:hypothetical protein
MNVIEFLAKTATRTFKGVKEEIRWTNINIMFLEVMFPIFGSLLFTNGVLP